MEFFNNEPVYKQIVEMSENVPIIEQMLSEPEKPAPAFFIDPSVTDFYAFTKDSFRLEGYEPCPFEAKIPIAV